MFCEECGAQVRADSKFCEACGAQIASGDVSKSGQETGSSLGEASQGKGASERIDPYTGEKLSSPAHSASSTQQTGRVTSLAGLGLFVLSLLLPWVEVSCATMRVEFEGHRFLLGTTEQKLQPLSQQIGQWTGSRQTLPTRREPNLWVLGWAILLLLGGGAVASTPKRDGPVFGLLAAVVAGGILYLFYLKTNQEVQSVLAQSMGLIQFNWAIGFWMAMGATILVGIGALIRLGESR